MTQPPAIAEIKDRRQVFREYMKRFDPVASARDAYEARLICEDPGRTQYMRLAARADLDVGCQQLLVGGIGSGKTTQLLMARQRLHGTTNALAVYLDVTAPKDLSQVQRGSLIRAIGLQLAEFTAVHVSPSLRMAVDRIQDVESLEGPKANDVGQLVRHIAERGQEVVAIFDGLDRLIRPEQFWEIVEQDLHGLKDLNISVIMTGPLSLMYGAGRQIKDYFDHVEYLSPATADASDMGLPMRILDTRGARSLMDTNEMRELSLASGGVLRDLISLARSAGFSAFLDNEDRIGSSHVKEAIAELGRTYHLTLGTKQVKVLREILAGTGFDPSRPGNMELLINRQVLERESTYEVHPALARALTV